jgi:hypothetical protein
MRGSSFSFMTPSLSRTEPGQADRQIDASLRDQSFALRVLVKVDNLECPLVRQESGHSKLGTGRVSQSHRQQREQISEY